MSDGLATAYVRIRPDSDLFRQETETDVKKALRDVTGTVRLIPDEKDLDARLRTVRAQLDEFSRKVATARVDVNDKDAQAKLLTIDAQLTALNKKVTRPKVDAVGVDKAIAELAVLDAALDKVGGRNVRANVSAGSAGAGIAHPLIAAGLASVPALSELTSVAAGGALGLGAGIFGAAAGAGAFAALAIPEIKNTLDLQKQLNKAQDDFAKAHQQLAQATTASQRATALKAEADALQQEKTLTDQITAGQRQFLDLLDQAKSSYKTAQDAAAPAVFRAANAALADTPRLIGALGPISNAVEPAVTGLFTDLGDALTGPGFARFQAFIERTAPRDITDLGHIAGNLGVTVGRAVQAVDPLTQQVLGGLERVTSRLAGADLGPDSGFGRFVTMVETKGPQIIHVLGDVAGAVFGVLHDLSPIGDATFDLLESAAGILQEARPTIREFTSLITPAVHGFAVVLHDADDVLGPLTGEVAGFWLAFKGYTIVKAATSAMRDFTLVQTLLGGGAVAKGGKGAAGLILSDVEGAAAGQVATKAGAGLLARTGAAAGIGGLLEAGGGLGGLSVLGTAGLGAGVLAAGGLLAYNYGEAQDRKRQAAVQKVITDRENFVPLNDLPGLQANEDFFQQKIASAQAKANPARRSPTGALPKPDPNYAKALEETSAKAQALAGNLQLLSINTGKSTADVIYLANAAKLDLSGAFSTVSPEATYLIGAMDRFNISADDQARKVLPGLKQAYEDFHNAQGDVATSAQGLSEYFSATSDAQLAAIQTGDDLDTRLKNTKLSLDGTSLAVDSNTDAAKNNRAQIAPLVQDIESMTVAQVKAGVPIDEVKKKFDAQYDSILNLAGSNTQAREQLRLLLEKMGLSKEDFDKFVGTVAPAKGAVDGLAGSLVDVRGQLALLRADFATAFPDANAVSTAANNKRVAQGATDHSSAGTAEDNAAAVAAAHLLSGHATGGLITGRGTGTSDSILTALSNGEYVINARSSAKYKSVLDAINLGSTDVAGMLSGQTGGGSQPQMVNHFEINAHQGMSEDQIAQLIIAYLRSLQV